MSLCVSSISFVATKILARNIKFAGVTVAVSVKGAETNQQWTRILYKQPTSPSQLLQRKYIIITIDNLWVELPICHEKTPVCILLNGYGDKGELETETPLEIRNTASRVLEGGLFRRQMMSHAFLCVSRVHAIWVLFVASLVSSAFQAHSVSSLDIMNRYGYASVVLKRI